MDKSFSLPKGTGVSNAGYAGSPAVDIVDTKIISLNSEDGIRLNGTNLSNIKFDLPNLITDNKNVYHRQISLLNAQIPFSFYNVNSNYNKIVIVALNTLKTITIPVGNYNSTNLFSTLTTAIFNAFSAPSITINFSVSKITGKIQMTSTSAFALEKNSTIDKILGFDDNLDYSSTLVGSIHTLNGIYPMNLLGTKKLQIRSTILSMNNYSSNNGGLNTLLTTIPVNAAPFGLIDYTSISNSLISFSNTNLDEIDISISDAEDNNLINFNNQNWTLTLAIYEYKKIDFTISNSTFENSTEQLLAVSPATHGEKTGVALGNMDKELQFLESTF